MIKNNKKTKLSNQPYKGTRDFYGQDMDILNYIFTVWRQVCLSFGYQEYQTPLLEKAELYRAKSGEDVGGKELFTLKDLAGRELAIRPEMTPSVVRFVSRIYQQETKPIRLFNICNYCRNEKPQRGRAREFWQLNADIFGDTSLEADLEILILAIEIMLAFKPPKQAFKVYLNSRVLIDDLLDLVVKVAKEKRQEVARIMDKFTKLTAGDFKKRLTKLDLSAKQIDQIKKFMEATPKTLISQLPELKNKKGYQDISWLLKQLKNLELDQYVEFKPNIVRGFDYYDGMIFEVFDLNPKNNRSLFGGGRYDGLADIFGGPNFPGVGFAPGNVTTELFLKDWNLLPKELNDKKVFIPKLVEDQEKLYWSIAKNLRQLNYQVELSTSITKIKNALVYADKKKFAFVVLAGQDEIEKNIISIKNLETGQQTETTMKKILEKGKIE